MIHGKIRTGKQALKKGVSLILAAAMLLINMPAAANAYTYDGDAALADTDANDTEVLTNGLDENDVENIVNIDNADNTDNAEDIVSDKSAKKLEVKEMEQPYGYILGYIRGNNDRTGSLHIAYSTDKKAFAALNGNSGILFAKNDTSNGNKNLSTGIRFAGIGLCRNSDGSFVLIAPQGKDNTAFYVYHSNDLLTYTGGELITKGKDGYDTYKAMYEEAKANVDGITVPAGASGCSIVGVTKEEYDNILQRFDVVSNSGVKLGVDSVTALTVSELSAALPKTAAASYSDGSKAALNIKWNIDKSSMNKAGTYTVTGSIAPYSNPLIEQRADPQIKYDESGKCYYFTASYPAFYNVDDGYDRIVLRKADSIQELSDDNGGIDKEITIWKAPSSGKMAKHVWAPELQKIGGKWYVFFAAGDSDNIWAIRPYVLVCQNNEEPYSADSWVCADGSYEIHAATSRDSRYFKHMSLDMTYLENKGKHYVIWADIIGQSALYMQEIDPARPWEGTSDKVVMLTTPEYGWERDTERVNEGPTILKHDGKIFCAFSASGTGPEYCIGMLYADENADLMDASSWTKLGYPLLTSSDVPGEYGPGHNSFTVDLDGNPVFVYHARSEECYKNKCKWASANSLYDPCRHARVKNVHWTEDGLPILKMSAEEECPEAMRSVSVQVTVKAQSFDWMLDDVVLPYSNEKGKEVYGNITLPEFTSGGLPITWTSDHPEIVDVNSHANAGYDDTPAGTVTRPAADTAVKLTAHITVDGNDAAKDYIFTVKAAPKKIKEEDYTDYFFTYFTGEGLAQGEQIYFASSEDGLNWTDLNDGAPSLISTLGERGVRDPYIIRSAEGDKFYIIATDLKINGGNGWTAAQTAGSRSLMVWESTDLVNWSKQRMVEISASIEAGCTWAPEATYDATTGEYIVYWASKVKNDGYSKQRLYYVKTRDFYSFTEPEVYIDLDQSTIDTTMIEHNGMYYRYSKNEGGADNTYGAHSKTVFIEKSDGVLGEFTHVESDSLNDNGGVEGPAIFKLNKDDASEDTWCLLVDNYGSGGYYPLLTTDLESGSFEMPEEGTYKMPANARHGTPIRITTKEYCRIMGLPYDEPEEDEPEKTAVPDNNKQGQTGTANPPDNTNTPPSVTAPPPAAKPVTPIVEQSKVTGNSIKVKWNTVSGADSYRIYYGEKGKKPKKYVEVSGSKKTAKLNKLKKGQYYRIRLCAYKKADGKKKAIAVSPDIYIATKGGSYNNPAAVKLSTKTLSVKAAGKVAGKAKIKAKIKSTGKQKVKYFVQKIRYISSDTSVAKVSKKGEVTGVSAGNCVIYCYTQNGKTGKVKVTVR